MDPTDNGYLTNGHGPDDVVWDGWPFPTALEGQGLHPGPGPAPDGPGGYGPSEGPYWTPGAGGHGRVADPWAGLMHMADREPAPAQAPLAGLLAPEPGAMSVLFGDGGVGKGTLAAYLVAQLTRQGLSILLADSEGHYGEWWRRLVGFGANLAAVAWAPHPGGHLRLDLAPQGYDLVVVDSAGYFHGREGDTWGGSVATMMQAEAVAYGAPMLVLAHVSKAGADSGKAYGTGYWHNAPRVTLELAERNGVVELECRKANDVLGMAKGQRWTATLDLDLTTMVPKGYTLEPVDRLAILDTYDRVVTILGDGAWHTRRELAERTGASLASVDRALGKLRGAGVPLQERTTESDGTPGRPVTELCMG